MKTHFAARKKNLMINVWDIKVQLNSKPGIVKFVSYLTRVQLNNLNCFFFF